MFTDTAIVGQSQFKTVSSWPFSVQLFPNLGYDEGKRVDYTATVQLCAPQRNFKEYERMVAAAAKQKLMLPKEEGSFLRMLDDAEIAEEATVCENHRLECRVNPTRLDIDPDYVRAAMAADALTACYGKQAPTLAGRVLQSPLALLASMVATGSAGGLISDSPGVKLAGAVAGSFIWMASSFQVYLAGVNGFYKGLEHLQERDRALVTINNRLDDGPRISKYARLHRAAEAIFNVARYRAGVTLTFTNPDSEAVAHFAQGFCEDKVVVPTSDWES